MRTALITGATGFIGSRLARHLLASGWQVHCLVRADSSLAELHGMTGSVTLHPHDGSTEQMLAIVHNSGPDVVFHLASLFLSQHRPDDIERLIQSNLLFATQLLEAMQLAGCSRLVNTGTSWQHYHNSDYSPVNLYAATKQAFEAILHYYLETTPLRAITLKLFDTYGPGDQRPKLFSMLHKVAIEMQPHAMSPGEQLIDLVYVDDVIAAFMLAAERLLNSRVERHEQYPVSSGKPLPLRELVACYEKVLGKELPIEWGARPYRPREVMIPWNRGEALPGWQPKVSLEDGLQRILSSGELH